jgi:hypothetical protein
MATTQQQSTQSPTQAPQVVKVKLADLEKHVITVLKKDGIKGDAADLQTKIAAVGDPTVNAGELEFYTAAKYGNGAWVSNALLKRVRAALTPKK